jgi:hypothetical protein
MPIQVYIDDSGNDGRSRHFILAGLMSQAEHWALFSDEWKTSKTCLNQTPAIRRFKMTDAAGLSGQFFGCTAEVRDDKLLVA